LTAKPSAGTKTKPLAAKILAKLNANMAEKDIAFYFDCTVAEVRKVAAAAKAAGAVGQRMTHIDRKRRREEIREALKAGESLDAVAKKFGVSVALVRKIFDPAKMPSGPTANLRRKVSQARVYAELFSGMSMQEIADKYEVTKQAVFNAVKQARDEGLFKAVKKCVKDGRELPE